MTSQSSVRRLRRNLFSLSQCTGICLEKEAILTGDVWCTHSGQGKPSLLTYLTVLFFLIWKERVPWGQTFCGVGTREEWAAQTGHLLLILQIFSFHAKGQRGSSARHMQCVQRHTSHLWQIVLWRWCASVSVKECVCAFVLFSMEPSDPAILVTGFLLIALYWFNLQLAFCFHVVELATFMEWLRAF